MGVSLSRGSLSGGLCPGGSLSGGSLSEGSFPGGLCLRVSVQGVSVWGGSLSAVGLCPGGLCPGGLCPGGSVWGSLLEKAPLMVTSRRYASYWNAFLSKNIFVLEIKIEMCKICTAFQVFFASVVQYYFAICFGL